MQTRFARGRPAFRKALSIALIAWLSGAALTCDPSTAPKYQALVQIVSVKAAPQNVDCSRVTQYPIPVQFDIHLINTTSNDVTVTNVSSSGIIATSTDSSRVGRQVNMFDKLQFTPATLVAKTGDLTMSAWMTGQCTQPPTLTMRVTMTVYITTTAGQYATPPVDITIINH